MTGDRLRAAAMVAAGLALVVTPFVAPVAGAQGDELIAYLGLADSDAVTQTGGDPTSQGYPQAQSKTAHTFSSLDTGANGLALASTQWPGELAGNAGSLAQVFGAPEEAAALNYPVRAEASTVGPAESSQAGMYARVEGPLAEAIATAGGFEGDGSELLTYGDAETVSRSQLVDGELVVTATALVSDISIGGIITIDSVRTVATARSDGEKGASSGSAVVQGLEIAGQPARVDGEGVHAGDGTSDNPADAVSQAVIDDVLSHFAEAFVVEMYMSEPRTRDEGALQEYRSGALVITMQLGDPSAGQGGDGVFAIGGSNAYAQAAAGAPFDGSVPLPESPTSLAPSTTPPSPVDTGDFGSGSPGPAVTSSSPETPEEVETATPPVLETVPVVDRFDGLGFVMPFILLLGGLLAGRGLHRFHAAVVTPHGHTGCIIEEEAP